MKISLDALFSIVKRIAFLLTRLVFSFIRWPWNEIHGINRTRRQAILAENYTLSAEILSIQARNQFCHSHLVTLSDFILTHEAFTAPEYVLTKDSVSLYFVNEDWAVFCDSGEETPLWDMKYGPFYRMSAFNKATKLVIMPMVSFLHLAESMDYPQSEVMFIWNTARCGSTLLAKIFVQSGQTSVRSEPESLNYIEKMCHRQTPRFVREQKQIIVATLKLECKPLESVTPKAIIMKITGNNVNMETAIRDSFPQAKHMLLYRNMPDSVTSMLTAGAVVRSIFLGLTFHGYNHLLDRYLDDIFVCSHNPLRVRFHGRIEHATLIWMSVVKHYLTHVQDRYTPAFRYEDLISIPRQVVSEIFKIAGLNPECVTKAISACSVHSQENSPVAASKLTKTRVSRDVIIKVCEKMLHEAGLPNLSELDILPGTQCVHDK